MSPEYTSHFREPRIIRTFKQLDSRFTSLAPGKYPYFSFYRFRWTFIFIISKFVVSFSYKPCLLWFDKTSWSVFWNYDPEEQTSLRKVPIRGSPIKWFLKTAQPQETFYVTTLSINIWAGGFQIFMISNKFLSRTQNGKMRCKHQKEKLPAEKLPPCHSW